METLFKLCKKKEKPLINGSQGLEVIKIIEAIRKSSNSSSLVYLN